MADAKTEKVQATERIAPEGAREAAGSGAGEPGAPSAPAPAPGAREARPRRIVAGIVAVCSVALIAASALFLFPGANPGASAADALKTTQESQEAQAGDDASDAAQEGGVAADAAAGEGDAEAQGEPAAAPSADGSAGTPSLSAPAAAGGGGAAANAAGGAGSSASDPAPVPAPEPAPANTVSVTVIVESSAVGGPVSASASPTFERGATVYDALCATGLSVNASSTAYGIYVSAIGGLAQMEHGSNSGWKYSVNGEYVNVACNACVLSDGDVVTWYYEAG